MDAEYHNSVFSIQKKNIKVDVGGYGVANGRILEKKIDA